MKQYWAHRHYHHSNKTMSEPTVIREASPLVQTTWQTCRMPNANEPKVRGEEDKSNDNNSNNIKTTTTDPPASCQSQSPEQPTKSC
jgi:hypothetical protein